MLNEVQSKFIALANQYEIDKDALESKRLELETLMSSLDYNSYVQDPETLVVYKVIEPTGTFISFRKIDYKRTNLEGEKSGGSTVLSKKEAEEVGFVLKPSLKEKK